MKKLEKYLECAVIASTHGLRGTVRLENRCDTPKVLAGLKRMFRKDGDTYTEMKVISSSVQKSMVLTTFEGIDSVEAASALRSTVLYADRDDFQLDGGYFIADILGLPVIDSESGERVGILSDVIQPGAQQIYVVKDKNGTFMIPCVPEFILSVSLGGENEKDEGIYVRLIDGMRGDIV